MKVVDILKSHNHTSVSFEFFPPKTEKGFANLFHTMGELNSLKPSYVSVTYGAGGSTRENTHRLVTRIKRESAMEVVAHLTCVGSTRDEVARILDEYDEAGVSNILALRGDLPQGMTEWNPSGKGFEHAADLVGFIKERKPHFGIGAAGFPEGHPEAPNRLREVDFLKEKIDRGADYIVTQLFFDNRDYYDFVDRCSVVGIKVPVVAGIMAISSRKSMKRMAELSANARFPAPLIRLIERADDDDLVARAGIHWATEQVRDLVDKGVPGIHIYTLNNSHVSTEICQTLGLRDFSSIRNY
ncbi:MAG: methylenetetrahydrofolate reductase [NAD(P)H] [Spirochaetales bacterium]|nr:methylenetetrahydrofolate reductase [NAD(P)H] [Spirochaetales bacterium]